MKIILTGATGYVGEGVLLSLLQTSEVEKVLSVSRKPCEVTHEKLEEYIVSDFMDLPANDPKLQGYNACFFCAGKSNIGMSKEDYYHLSYEITMHFAEAIGANSEFVFIYLSGAGTSDKSSQFWSQTKAKTECDLMAYPFKSAFGFRPAGIKPIKGQKRLQGWGKYHWLFTWISGFSNSVEEITQAMINVVRNGYHKSIVDVSDIKHLVKRS